MSAISTARGSLSSCSGRARRKKQGSPEGSTPPEHRLLVQVGLQASVLKVLPSSHSSPKPVTPLPQRGRVQLLSQKSPFSRLPSSHSSPLSTTLSPHRAGWQLVRHRLARVSELFTPSSHCSATGSRMPSPHCSILRHEAAQ